jgi:hypothetical protein
MFLHEMKGGGLIWPELTMILVDECRFCEYMRPLNRLINYGTG